MNSYPKNDITLRDWFAGLAMQGLLAAQANGPLASMAYEMADAMLRAREAKETDLSREQVKVLDLLPDETEMIEHNPDEGPRMFCCGREVIRGYYDTRITHDKDCWYAQMRAMKEAKTMTTHPEITHCDNGPNPVDCPQPQPKRRRYDLSGSLSEYGISPECDAQLEKSE